jgi:hypothetical protein
MLSSLQTPGIVPHTNSDQVLAILAQQNLQEYSITYQQTHQTMWHLQGSWPAPNFTPLPFFQNHPPHPPLQAPTYAAAVVPPLVTFEFGKNKHRAENILEEFKIDFGNYTFDLETLQKLCFIVGMDLAPDTASDCRMVCQSLP